MMNHMAPLLAASTAQIERQVQLFGTLSVVFAVVAVLFLIASAALFVVFDIRTVIGEKTGRVAKKTIEEMERSTAQSGKLRSRHSRSERKGGDTGGLTGQQKAVDQLFDVAGSAVTQTTPLAQPAASSQDAGSQAASVLNEGGSNTTVLNGGDSNTTVLNSGMNETTVLSQSQAEIHYEGPDGAPTAPLEDDRKVPIGKFVLIKNIMLIHTDEYI